MNVELYEKRCSACGVVKPLSSYYRQASSRDGHNSKCRDCYIARVQARAAERRAEMGDTAWLAHQRQITTRSRRRRGYGTERRRTRAVNRAIAELIDRHRSEYDALLQRAIYEEPASELEAVS